MLDRVARKQQIALDTKLPSNATRAVLPEGEVKQILYNLIRKAIQASPPGETVIVRAQRCGDEVQVTVCARGAGIADDVLPHIFDPFFSTKGGDPRAGMGLGLPVSRSLTGMSRQGMHKLLKKHGISAADYRD